MEHLDATVLSNPGSHLPRRHATPGAHVQDDGGVLVKQAQDRRPALVGRGTLRVVLPPAENAVSLTTEAKEAGQEVAATPLRGCDDDLMMIRGLDSRAERGGDDRDHSRHEYR